MYDTFCIQTVLLENYILLKYFNEFLWLLEKTEVDDKKNNQSLKQTVLPGSEGSESKTFKRN